MRDTPALELMSPASLGVVCFRRRFEGARDEDEIAALNAGIVSSFEQTGRGLVSSTRLHGTYAIRMCVMNHTTGAEDVTDTLDWFATAATPTRAAPQPMRGYAERRADMSSGFGQVTHFDAPTFRDIRLFQSLGDRELDILVRSGQELKLKAGETVIEQWAGTRSFYVILAGSVEIEIGGERVRELGPGQFFGELAALDWGAGFGYVRTANVNARSAARLLVLTPAVLGELVSAAPDVERQIRAAVRERLRPT